MLAVAFALASLGSLARTAGGQPTFEEIVDRLSQVNASLQTLIVEQVADIRLLGFFRWRLHATVYAARPASYKVVIHDAPYLLRGLGQAFSDISSPERVLADYRAVAIRSSPEGRLVVDIVGNGPQVNPPSGTIVVDTQRWLVEESLLKYDWGDVRASYRYDQIGGYLLPVLIRVSVPAVALHAEVTYGDYRLNVPIPPETFAKADGGR